MIKVFEAFSGIGTQRMALRNLGIEHEVVAIAEIDKYAIASYDAKLKKVVFTDGCQLSDDYHLADNRLCI